MIQLSNNPEFISFADNDVQIYMHQPWLVAEGRICDELDVRHIRVVRRLASNLDVVQPKTVLLKELATLGNTFTEATINKYLYEIRVALGEKLGDAKKGALRTKYGIGHYAVSSLELIEPALSTVR